MNLWPGTYRSIRNRTSSLAVSLVCAAVTLSFLLIDQVGLEWMGHSKDDRTRVSAAVRYLRTLQITHKSPELRLWESTPDGAEIVKAARSTGTPTGSGIYQ